LNALEPKENIMVGINLIIEAEKINTQSVLLADGKNIDLDMLGQQPELKDNCKAQQIVKKFVEKAKEKGFETYGKLRFDGEQLREGVENRRRRGR